MQRCVKTTVSFFVISLLIVMIAGCGTASVSDRLDQASQSLDAGKYRAAEIQLKSILQKHKDNGRAWLLLARVSLAQYQYADAAHQFEQAGKYGVERSQFAASYGRALIGNQQYKTALGVLAPAAAEETSNPEEFWTERGNALIGLERFDEARDAFDKALGLKANYAPALIGNARLTQQNGDDGRARALLEQAVDANPNYAPALAALGRLDYSQDQCARAEKRFDQALNSGKNQLSGGELFQLRSFLADCQLRRGENQQAERNIAILVKTSPDNPYANYLQALIDARGQHYADATTHLQRVLRVAPDNVSAQTLLASVKLAQNDPRGAELYLNQVLAQSPDNVAALRMRTGLLLQQGDSGQAMQMLQRAYQDSSDSQGVRMLLAQAMAQVDSDKKKQEGSSSSGANNANADDPALQIDLAQALAQQGNSDAALEILNKTNPEDPEQIRRAGFYIVSLQLARGDIEKALGEARKLADQYPDNIRVLRVLARTYAAHDQIDDAQQALAKAQRQAPNDSGVELDLASLALQRNRIAEAEKRLQAILSDNPDNMGAMLAMAQAEAQSGHSKQALDWLERAHQSQPGNVEISGRLIRAYVSTDQPKRAIPIAQQLVADNPNSGVAYRLQGLAQFAAGQDNAGLKSLRKASQNAPDQPAYQLDLAQAELSQGETDAGMRDLEQLRESHPDFSPAIRILALAQARQGHMAQALDTAKKLGGGDDGTLLVNTVRGEIYALAKKHSEAAAAYTKAYDAQPSRALALNAFQARVRAGQSDPEEILQRWLKKTPQDTAVSLSLAQWYQHNDRPRQASAQYQRLLKAQPDNVVALNNLALVYVDLNDDSALDIARKAHKLAPQSPAVTDTLGWVLVQNDRLEEGLPLLDQAASAESAGPDIRYHLAAALSRTDDQQDRVRARDILKSVLQSKQPFADRSNAEQLMSRISGDKKTAKES